MKPNKKNKYLNLLLDKHGLESRITVANKHQPNVHLLFNYIHKKIFEKINTNS